MPEEVRRHVRVLQSVRLLLALEPGSVIRMWASPVCPGSRAVRSDGAAAHRPERISPNRATPPVRRET
ncbi:hypothetical protein ACFV1U_19355 [Streptomyces microflavus]|uniref:hypothetical protein n=1 Tax=Streptomyces microflavus TaxID=1919 RepID=UPI000A43DF6D|nr:hypothetical protein [Streptomyces sp. MBT57]